MSEIDAGAAAVPRLSCTGTDAVHVECCCQSRRNVFMRTNRVLFVAAVLAAAALFGCGVESADETSSTQQDDWVGGHDWWVCGGGVHLRAWPSDAAPIPPGSGNGGFAPDGTGVHTYSNYDSEDGTLHWDPA